MEQENKEMTADVVFVENTDIAQVENQPLQQNEPIATENNMLENVAPVEKKNTEASLETATEKPVEKTEIKEQEKNDKPVIERKQTTGVASYVSVPEITITPENTNIKTISTFAVFDYLMAIAILLLFTKTSVKFKTEKIITRILTPIKKHTFFISVFCFGLATSMFFKSDFFNIGLQGKLSFGVNLLFIIFVNITAIFIGLYGCQVIRKKSKKIAKISGEKFALLGLGVFNVISILLFFITESLFGLLLSFILTLIKSIIFLKGVNNEKFTKFYGFATNLVLFQIMILGIFLKSSSILMLFCLLFINTFFNKRI